MIFPASIADPPPTARMRSGRNAAICDWDGDGENEVVVRTRWQEKPYTVYDMADGELVSLWPDTVPQEVRDKLVCIWEQ